MTQHQPYFDGILSPPGLTRGPPVCPFPRTRAGRERLAIPVHRSWRPRTPPPALRSRKARGLAGSRAAFHTLLSPPSPGSGPHSIHETPRIGPSSPTPGLIRSLSTRAAVHGCQPSTRTALVSPLAAADRRAFVLRARFHASSRRQGPARRGRPIARAASPARTGGAPAALAGH
jgi:hypothetical protein